MGLQEGTSGGVFRARCEISNKTIRVIEEQDRKVSRMTASRLFSNLSGRMHQASSSLAFFATLLLVLGIIPSSSSKILGVCYTGYPPNYDGDDSDRSLYKIAHELNTEWARSRSTTSSIVFLIQSHFRSRSLSHGFNMIGIQ